jgi:hypothetical protein
MSSWKERGNYESIHQDNLLTCKDCKPAHNIQNVRMSTATTGQKTLCKKRKKSNKLQQGLT